MNAVADDCRAAFVVAAAVVGQEMVPAEADCGQLGGLSAEDASSAACCEHLFDYCDY